MPRTSKNYLLLFLIVIFSFVYRVALMLRETYPPGADIGLHNSIIYSITQSGNTNFLYNYFHMGGGSSVTFPGYHIFTSYIVLLTGISDYVAHALVVSLFSSFIVLVGFLLTRKAWGPSAALLVAFLIGVSRFDIEMLMWGGYPNVITLMLIPLAFYLFLEKNKFSMLPFLTVTSLLAGAIFLTHSLSALLFIVITVATVIFTTIFAKKTGERRTSLFIWILPLILGAALISPFLVNVVPAYLSADASTFTGGVAAIRLAHLSTQILPLNVVLPLFACVFLFFLYSKRYIGKYLSVPAILLVLWTLIPAVLTQGYLIGLFTDYNRFLYFVLLPIILLIGVSIYHGAEFFAQAIDWLISITENTPQIRMNKHKSLNRLLPHLTRKNILTAFLLSFLVAAFLTVPVFVVPEKGIAVQSFYQLMNQPKFEAIEWAKKNTPADSLFLTDAQYGWWFSGFAQRRTISGVEPQYLTNSREFAPAKVALSILDSDYIVDNGLIQVREDGGYIARHNPEFLAKLNNSYFPYPFFNFDNGDMTVTLSQANGNNILLDMSQVPVKEMYIENDTEQTYSTIYTKWGNEFFNFTQTTTINKDIQFVKMTEKIESDNPSISLDTIEFILHTNREFVQGQNNSVVGFVDKNMKVIGQLMFTDEQPIIKLLTPPNAGPMEIKYILSGRKSVEMSFYVGVYQYDKSLESGLESDEKALTHLYESIVADHAKNYNTRYPDSSLDVFDYRQGLKDQVVSYIALRDLSSVPRFAKDPMFRLVFINNEVAIFQVQK